METVCKQNQCTGCMACVESCAKNAIRIEDAFDSYNAVINKELCIDCGLCHRTCPNNKPAIKHEPIEWCEGWASDDIRKNASSGGVASAIIKSFIEQGGYVASCLFKKGSFSFEITNNVNEAKKFSGSKYVKSNPLGIYKKIKLLLSKNEKVLFLGLPCQVAGLKNYLNLETNDNLYTVDLICHGSPSPKILDLFLRENNVDIEHVKDVRFRNKAAFEVSAQKSKEDYIRLSPAGVQDMYTYAFLNALDYTENCYACRYASLDRVSDITLGDSWSSKLAKEEQNKGISLILCQTEKGKKLIQDTKLTLGAVDLKDAIAANHQLSHPSIEPGGRKNFFDNLPKGFEHALFASVPKIYLRKKLKTLLLKAKILRGGGEKIIEYAVQYIE